MLSMIILCSASLVEAQNLSQIPDSSNDGGYTGDTGVWLQQQMPSDNDGGFTSKTASQQDFTYSQPVSSNNNSWATPGNNYLTQKPSDFDQLTETGIAPGSDTPISAGQQGPNGLWIVDSTGLNRYPEMSIPLYGYVREELTPSVEGQITIEEMYPDGKVRTYGMGYVRPYHIYKMWFYGDVPGTHMVRYNINGYYSNIVRFYVQGTQSQSQSMSNPVSSSGSTVTRVGNKIVRSGSSSSSMSISGGSMSISTSFG